MNSAQADPLPLGQMARVAASALARDETDTAYALYQRLTECYPDFADGWHYYGLLLHRLGRSDEALESLGKAVALTPENPILLANLARVLADCGRIEETIACLTRAHELDPDHAQILMQLAKSLIATERGDLFIPELERHLGWAAGEWRLWLTLGQCREQGGDREGAAAAFSKAVELAPVDEIEPRLRRADCERKRGRPSLAREDLATALRIQPGSPRARVRLALHASEDGDFETSERLAREALRDDPRLYAGWGLIAAAHPLTTDEQLARELDDAATRAGDERGAWVVHFARGRILEKLGDYDQAFAAYERGNSLQRNYRRYVPEEAENYVRDLIHGLDSKFLERARQTGVTGSGAIFVCGMPRSGTTLVETILASHSRVRPGGELRYIHDRLRHTLGMAGLTETGTWLQRASNETLRAIARDWAQSLQQTAGGVARVTDKMPGNFGLLGLVKVCLPDAHVIHVSRDSRDTCFSCFAIPFDEGHAYTCALDSVAHYYRLYEAQIAHWRKNLPAGSIIEIRYEALVDSFESETRRLLEALGLEWEPQCLDFYRTRRTVSTASQFQVRQPLYKTSISRWEHFEQHLAPLLESLAAPNPLV